MTARPEEREPSLEVARHLLAVNRARLAEREVRHWLSQNPDCMDGAGLLAYTLLAQKRNREALECAERLLGMEADNPYPHLVMAEVNMHLRRHAAAEQSARAALELDPDDPRLYATLADALLARYSTSANEEALAVAEAGLEVDPESTPCARARTVALSRLERHDEAREAATYALRLAPERAEFHTMAGFVELGAGEPLRSRELLRQALRLNPEDSEARRALRMAAEGDRLLGAMAVQAQRWSWPLRAAALVYLLASGMVLARDGLRNGMMPSLVLVAVVGGAIAWTRFYRPGIVAEMRLAPDAPEARLARGFLVLLAGVACVPLVLLTSTGG